MKIIPKQKRKVIALFLKIIIIVAVLFCVYKVAEFMYDLWGFEEIEYEDVSHVLEIFEENESDFNSMVEVLQRTNINRILFDDYMDNPKPLMPCPGDALKNPKYQIRRRGFLKGEDYKSICNFFKKYGPICIEGTMEFRFDFDTKDDVVSLCYIPENIRDVVLETLMEYNETVICLNENWYFAE
ncbi:MAG: hypothetical protein IJZ20_04075 [Clostridia bacterium]|nr:hypothetical protein [Clostridia bacterium]